jgi:hypothetical protein
MSPPRCVKSAVLKPNGKVVLIDIVGAEDPLCDTWLQSVELLRDPSHIRDYTPTCGRRCSRQPDSR